MVAPVVAWPASPHETRLLEDAGAPHSSSSSTALAPRVLAVISCRHGRTRSVSRAASPAPSAARVAAVPYDVVNTEEARALAAGNPLSFLHVSRAEIDLPGNSTRTETMSMRRREETSHE